MQSLSRISLVIILCAMSGFGQVPALMHLASCCNDLPPATELECSDCCCEHEAKPEPTSHSDEGEHNSDDCRICQSILLLPEVSSQALKLSVLEPFSEGSIQLASQPCPKALQSLAHPRGPPV